MGRHGSGEGGCLRGRKRWSGSVAHYFIILLCRLERWIGGNGFCIYPMVIQLTKFIIYANNFRVTTYPYSIWHKEARLKVSLFVWWLHRNQISTKDNLLRHDIIQYDYVLCF